MTYLATVAGADRIELHGERWRAVVAASPLNQRLRVLEHRGPDLAGLSRSLRDEAEERGFGKVFLKAPALERPALEASGMEAEATLWGYFDGMDGVVMSMFVDASRRRRAHAGEQTEILAGVTAHPPESAPRALPQGYEESTARPQDADQLAGLYREVFASYPFPITDPDYLRETMATHVVYRLVRDGGGRIVAAASAETAPELHNAEMTDFATRPEERGHGLALRLLAGLEDEMGRRGITNLYTIARARSFGMNRVFYNRGYELTGTLVNNCHIAGQFEDMHVWCRSLGRRGGDLP